MTHLTKRIYIFSIGQTDIAGQKTTLTQTH